MHRASLAALALAACSSGAAPRSPGAGSASGDAAGARVPPPVDVPFRWSATGGDCVTWGDVRGRSNRCTAPDAGAITTVPVLLTIAAYPAPSVPGAVEVVRFDAPTAQAGTEAWRRPVVLDATAPPVVAVLGDRIAVAAVGSDTVGLAILATRTGAVLGTTHVAAPGATAVQLERRAGDTQLRVDVLLRDGSGRVAVIDPAAVEIVGVHAVAAAAIRTAMEATAIGANGDASVSTPGGDVAVRWDGDKLVAVGPRWQVVVVDDHFRMRLVTLHVAGDAAIATLHHPNATGVEALAVGLADGALRWRTALTGVVVPGHSGYANAVGAFVDGDLLVVQGVESFGPYICTVDVATGREQACVDAIAPDGVIAPPPPTTAIAPLPPVRYAPTIRRAACKPSHQPRASFTLKPATGDVLTGVVVAPSASCKARLGGGIAGDRIELEVYDGSDRPGAPRCECVFAFEARRHPDSRRAVAHVRGGAKLGVIELP